MVSERRPSLARRVLRRLLRRLWGGRVVLVVALGLALVAGAVGLFQSSSLPGIGLPLPSVKRAPDATENYLKAQQTFNAELMLNSLSDEALDRMRQRGFGLEQMQRQMDQARDRGARYDQINYIGGMGLPDGTSMQFYVVAARGPTNRSEVEYVTYIFTLDRFGKISKVQ